MAKNLVVKKKNKSKKKGGISKKLKSNLKNKKVAKIVQNANQDEELYLADVIAMGGCKSDMKLVSEKVDKKSKENLKKEDLKKFLDEFKTIQDEDKVYDPLINFNKKQEEEKTDIREESTKVQVLELTRNRKVQILPKKCLIKEPYVWSEIFTDDPQNEGLDSESREVKWLSELAEKFFNNEVELYKKVGKESNGNKVWMQNVITSGTMSDRFAALSLNLSNSPIHNLESFERLLKIANKKEKRICRQALVAIKDVLINVLLPDRRLRPFYKQPIKSLAKAFVSSDGSANWSHESCKKRMILWWFEDKLKKLMVEFVDRVRELTCDPLKEAKKASMLVAFEILNNKPEQEKAFLQMIVNKLGDPTKDKIAQKALDMANKLIERHPLMQSIVINEVRDLLFQSQSIGSRCQYYCINLLNQQMLSIERKDVAQSLVKIYMNFFKACTKKSIKSDDKMLGALLTGMSRAFPYADIAEKEVSDQIDLLFKTTHVTNLNTTIRALMLLQQMFNARDEPNDRFYNALYSSLMHKELPVSSSRHPMFFNLMFRSLKHDPIDVRVQAILKRLLQVCSFQSPAFIAASMVLIHAVINSPNKAGLKYQLFNRIEGAAEATEKNGIAGKGQVENNVDSDSDGEEHFVDVHDPDSDVETNEKEEPVEKEEEEKKSEGWVHKKKVDKKQYNPSCRNPLYAGVSPMFELYSMRRHFHPTVSKYANDLLSSNNTEEKLLDKQQGDPLEDFTLLKFLEKFKYRNAKKHVSNASSMHQKPKKQDFSENLPVNSMEFLSQTNIRPEDVFFHKYFSQLHASKKHPTTKRSAKKSQGDDEIEVLSDDEFENFIKSEKGQKQLDNELNMKDHVYKNKTSLDEEDVEMSDDDNFSEDDGDMFVNADDIIDDDGELVEEIDDDWNVDDLMGDESDSDGFVDEFAEDDEEPPQKRSKNKSSKQEDEDLEDDEDMEMFDELMSKTDNNSIGSNALVFDGKVGKKQMAYERKKMESEIIKNKKKGQKRKKFGKKKGGRK